MNSLTTLAKDSYKIKNWKSYNKSLCNRGRLTLWIDDSLKVYGEGEWKVHKYGYTKRRTWRKLHIGIDVYTQEIISVALTANDEDDAAVSNTMGKGCRWPIK